MSMGTILTKDIFDFSVLRNITIDDVIVMYNTGMDIFFTSSSEIM